MSSEMKFTREEMLKGKAKLAEWANSTAPNKDTFLAEQLRTNLAANNIKKEVTSKGIESMKACANIAKNCSDDDWVNFVTTGEVPLVELPPSQMEHLRGGIFATSTVGLAALVFVGVKVYEANHWSWW